MLRGQAEIFGDKPLFMSGDTVWSFAETVGVAERSAAMLRQVGLRAGDRVAILCSNRSEFMQVLLGCAWLGLVLVPINVASRGAKLRHVFANARPRLLVVEKALVDLLNEGEGLPETLETVWVLDGASSRSEARCTVAPMPPLGEARAEAHPVRPGDTMAILYTSGTTGPAKGVCCPHAQFYWWGIGTGDAFGLTADDVLFTTLPLFHTNALNTFYQALLHGCTYVLEPRFSASGFWPAAIRCGATITYLLGAMAGILLSRPPGPDDRAHRLRAALGGGVPAKFHGPFLERFRLPLLDGYGSTETNFAFGSPIPSDHPGTMGYPVDTVEARVVDDDDTPLPDGVAGELVLRAREPFCFATGYYGMPDTTVEAWRNLWFHTGDRVLREPDGHFRFIDRMKDAIRRRGENISSWEVEEALSSHPAIASCAVYPVPSELGEDEVMAALLFEPGATVRPEDVLRHCAARLAYFAVPRFLRVVAALPLTENGKIQKFQLRQEGVTADSWDRESVGFTVR